MSVDKSALMLLAEFLTEGEVGFHSVGLSMPEGSTHHARAKRFFELRKALGIEGYADKDAAMEVIRRKITEG